MTKEDTSEEEETAIQKTDSPVSMVIMSLQDYTRLQVLQVRPPLHKVHTDKTKSVTVHVFVMRWSPDHYTCTRLAYRKPIFLGCTSHWPPWYPDNKADDISSPDISRWSLHRVTFVWTRREKDQWGQSVRISGYYEL